MLDPVTTCIHEVLSKIKIQDGRSNMSGKNSRQTVSLEQTILRCTRAGNIDELRVYLKSELKDELLSWRHPKSGESCLLLSSRYGHVALLKCLDQEFGESLEQWNNDGKRALHEAALGGHLDCVRYLVKRNVEIDCLKRADWLVII